MKCSPSSLPNPQFSLLTTNTARCFVILDPPQHRHCTIEPPPLPRRSSLIFTPQALHCTTDLDLLPQTSICFASFVTATPHRKPNVSFIRVAGSRLSEDSKLLHTVTTVRCAHHPSFTFSAKTQP